MSRDEKNEYQDSPSEEDLNLFINYIIMKKIITSIIISMLFFTPLFATECNSARCTLESNYTDWIEYVEKINLYIQKNDHNDKKLDKLLSDVNIVLETFAFPNTEKWNKVKIIITFLQETLEARKIFIQIEEELKRNFPEIFSD